MKRIILSIILLLFSFSAYAGGGITHMYIAQESIQYIHDSRLRNLLLNNLDAYLVGAYYPDSGYIKDTGYGEDSHWNPFLYAFQAYLNNKYQDPITQNPKLVAFMFGCAAHSLADIVIHWTFYNENKFKDFKGDWNSAHNNGDPGIDMLLAMDKGSAVIKPKNWWFPVDDLLQIYHRMGKDQYTRKEIMWGTAVIHVGNVSERIITAVAYAYYKFKMPWTAANYYTWPKGGIATDIKQVAEFQDNLWNRLTSKNPEASTQTNGIKLVEHSAINEFAAQALGSNVVEVRADIVNGNVSSDNVVIKNYLKFHLLIQKLLKNYL